MSLDNLQDAKFSDICSRFPLKPIEDDGSYQAAIEILDRLFALDVPRTPAESDYFQTLANFTSQYEFKRQLIKSSTSLRRSREF